MYNQNNADSTINEVCNCEGKCNNEMSACEKVIDQFHITYQETLSTYKCKNNRYTNDAIGYIDDALNSVNSLDDIAAEAACNTKTAVNNLFNSGCVNKNAQNRGKRHLCSAMKNFSDAASARASALKNLNAAKSNLDKASILTQCGFDNIDKYSEAVHKGNGKNMC